MEGFDEDVVLTVSCAMPWDEDNVYVWHFQKMWEIERDELELPDEIRGALYSFTRHYQVLTALYGVQPCYERMKTQLAELHQPEWPVPAPTQAFIGLMFVHNVVSKLINRTFYNRINPLTMCPVEGWALHQATGLVMRDLAPLYRDETSPYPFRQFAYFPEVMELLECYFAEHFAWFLPNPLCGYYRILPQAVPFGKLAGTDGVSA